MASVVKGPTTSNTYIDALLYEDSWHWTDLSVPGSSFPTLKVFLDNSGDGGKWTAQEIFVINQVFESIEHVIDINIEQVFRKSGAQFVELKQLSGSFDPNEIAHHEPPQNATGPLSDGKIEGEFNTQTDEWGAMTVGGAGFYVLLHEFMHGLGLDHPHDGSVFPGVTNPEDLGTLNLNQALFTAMSYNVPWTNGSTLFSQSDLSFGGILGPSAFDIAALQLLYGANTEYHKFSDTYFLPDKDEIVGFSATAFLTIWDAGGTDEIAYTGSKDASIDLRAATLSGNVGGGGFPSLVSTTSGGTTTVVHGGFMIANGVIIENASGGSGSDFINGNDVDNRLSGNDGADKIFGAGGDDTIIGGNGADVIEADDLFDIGNDTVRGGAGKDTIGGGDGIDRLFGDEDIDHLSGDDGNDFLFGGTGADVANGGAGNDSVKGDDDNDTLSGGTGNDIMAGGNGFDTLRGDSGDDTLNGNGGFDTLIGGAGVDRLSGDAGNDELEGGAENDFLSGGANNDKLDGGLGVDEMRGGTGDDTYIVDDQSDVVIESRDTISGPVIILGGIDSVLSKANTYTLVDGTLLTGPVENLAFIGIGNFVGTGNSVDNLIVGGVGADRLFGLGGDDTLDGKDGADRLTGGLGEDLYFVDNLNDRVIEEIRTGGPQSLYADAGSANDTIVTTLGSYDLANIWSLNDVVISFPDRAVFGIIENLTMAAEGSGIAVGRGNDVANEIRCASTSTTSINYHFFGAGGDDTLIGGSALTGDVLLGGAGNDQLRANGGDDDLHGGAGGDVLNGGNGIDTAFYASASSGVGLNLETGGTLGEAAGDTFINIENVVGSKFADVITGDASDNVIVGGAGDDVLNGGNGRNSLSGGSGNDTLTGGNTFDEMSGGAGNDTLIGGSGQASMDGGDGDDTLIGSLGVGNSMQGGLGNDDMTGGNLGDVMQDSLGGDDTMHGGGGADTLVDLLGVNEMFGEGGDDFISDGSNDATLLDGGAGADKLFSSGGNDTLTGGSGSDTLEDQSGNDTDIFTGGADADIFVYRLTNDGNANITVTDFEDGVDKIGIRFANESFDHLVIENLAGNAVVTFTGGFSPMTLIGMAGLITQADFVDLF